MARRPWRLNRLATLTAALAVSTGAHAAGEAHKQHGNSTFATSANAAKSHSFSTSIDGLPAATATPIVELADGATYEMTAKPVKQLVDGKWVRRLAYNGSVPGPILKIKQGSTVKVILRNETELETTLHPHGVRVDDKNDGVPGVGQEPIKPGATYTYTLRFPDSGMFWYHPHIREDYGQDAGLYGGFWVEPSSPGVLNAVHREIPLFLDDVSLAGPDATYTTEKPTHTLMGRFGTTMLLNGSSSYELTVDQGEVVRFYLVNAANVRPFNLRLPGAKLKLVGSDNGLYEKETWVDSVPISPSERYVVEARFEKPGDTALLNAKPSRADKLGTIKVTKKKAAALPSAFDKLRAPTPTAQELEAVRSKLGIPVSKQLKLTLAMDHAKLPMSHGHSSAPKSKNDGLEWDDEMPEMNRMSDDKNVTWKLVDTQTKKENMAIDWTFKKGEYAKIRIVNDANSMHPMQHPIHFHGQRFVVAAVNGKTTDNLAWKDTVLVPAGQTVDIIVEASNVGRWMAHCHISEHNLAGMMLGFRVVDTTAEAATRRTLQAPTRSAKE